MNEDKWVFKQDWQSVIRNNETQTTESMVKKIHESTWWVYYFLATVKHILAYDMGILPVGVWHRRYTSWIRKKRKWCETLSNVRKFGYCCGMCLVVMGRKSAVTKVYLHRTLLQRTVGLGRTKFFLCLIALLHSQLNGLLITTIWTADAIQQSSTWAIKAHLSLFFNAKIWNLSILLFSSSQHILFIFIRSFNK